MELEIWWFVRKFGTSQTATIPCAIMINVYVSLW